MTALDGVKTFSQNAAFILAVGTCAAYGGMSAGAPNPTSAMGLSKILGKNAGVINIPGCPSHPDWIVGTIAYLLEYGKAPKLDSKGRPKDFYQDTLHNQCPNRWKFYEKKLFASELSELGCLFKLGCEGKSTATDCPIRKWNSPAMDAFGVNWCIGGRNPCHGCTEPGFPDEMAPFYTLEDAGKMSMANVTGNEQAVSV
jgi:hydrogenase small subunit